MDEDLEKQRLDCIVAAILTVGTLDSEGHAVEWTVNRYVQTLERLRKQGGAVHPMEMG